MHLLHSVTSLDVIRSTCTRHAPLSRQPRGEGMGRAPRIRQHDQRPGTGGIRGAATLFHRTTNPADRRQQHQS
eukprot:1525129-Prymnesium_polylepis.2